ncbi:MAG: hypothetical protein H6Q76_2232, partial [Firmicutes bacterium]|nr:hypothetical protein [Bacillota bacterium]
VCKATNKLAFTSEPIKKVDAIGGKGTTNRND